MRILIVKLSSIGDVVHTLPAAAAIRRTLPDAFVSWAVERRAGAILRDCPAIDELIEIEPRRWRDNWRSAVTLRDLKEQLQDGDRPSNSAANSNGRFDLAIDFQGLIKSGLVAFASSAHRRVGFETAELREKPSRLFLTDQVETNHLLHVIEKNLTLARQAISIGSECSANQSLTQVIAGEPYEFPIAISSSDEAYAGEVIADREGKFAIINPGGGWRTKLWPAESYGRLADWVATEYGLESLVTYGPGEESLAQSVIAGARLGSARPVRSTLKQFAAIARQARLFVGGDSGPLHLAAACGTPVVGLYGPTSPDRNGPFNPLDITVGRDLWCRANCHRRKCWHWECMEIPVSEMQRAVSRRLARLNQAASLQPSVLPQIGR